MAGRIGCKFAFCQFKNRISLIRQIECLLNLFEDSNPVIDKQGQFGYGDVWTWTALCADTKLIRCWQIGARGASSAYEISTSYIERSYDLFILLSFSEGNRFCDYACLVG
jgi:hypothetical protein